MSVWRLELLRLFRTPRWAGLLGSFLVFGITMPILTRYQDALFRHVGGGVTVIVPPATPPQGIAAYLQNAMQIGLLVAVLIAAGSLAFDARPEWAAFLRTRSPSMWTLVVPKYAVNAAAAAVCFVAGLVAAWIGTAALIGSVPAEVVVAGSVFGALYLAFAIAVVACTAAVARSVLVAGGLALVVLILLPAARAGLRAGAVDAERAGGLAHRARAGRRGDGLPALGGRDPGGVGRARVGRGPAARATGALSRVRRGGRGTTPMEGWPRPVESEGEMEQSTGSRGMPIGAVLAIVGGALLAVGSFLEWAKVSGGGVDSVTAKGVDGSDGYVTLIAGVVAIAAGVISLRAGKRALAVLAILAGLIGGGLGVYDALTAKDSVLDSAAEEIAPSFGATPEEVRGLLDDAVDAGQLDITLGIGLYIVIGGGVLALIGGALLLGRGGAPEPMPVASAGMPATAAPSWDVAPPSASPAGSARPARSAGASRAAGGSHPPERRLVGVNVEELTLDTHGRRVIDVTDRVRSFAAKGGGDGLVHVFAPHATAGVALMETGSGSEEDLEDLLERVLPRDDRYEHRHGSVGHGGDHLLPVFVCPSLVLAVEGGRLVLGTWQRVVLVDPNRENDVRRLRLSYLAG